MFELFEQGTTSTASVCVALLGFSSVVMLKMLGLDEFSWSLFSCTDWELNPDHMRWVALE